MQARQPGRRRGARSAHALDRTATLVHITIATRGRQPLFRDEATLRRAVRALARAAGDELVLFSLVDDHLHLVLLTIRPVGRATQAIQQALGPLASVSLEPSRPKAVESRAHLDRLVGYVLTQGPHHGLAQDPALWSGSCFLDLFGARVVPGLRLRIGSVLPRFRPEHALPHVGLTGATIRPAGDDEVYRYGAAHLVHAAAAAGACGPALRGNAGPCVDVRAAVISVGFAAGFSARDLAQSLEISPRSVNRLAQREPTETAPATWPLSPALPASASPWKPPCASAPPAYSPSVAYGTELVGQGPRGRVGS